jgi:tetratricopeptide (TPR) repeat protein
MSTEELKTPEEQAAFVRDALARGEELRKAKSYKEAIALLVEALRYGIDRAPIYYRLGNVYHDAGDLPRAEYAYQRTLVVDPDHVNAMHNLAVVYKKQKKVSLFVKTYKKSQKLELRADRSAVPLSQDQSARLRRHGRRALVLVAAAAGVIVVILLLVLR